MVNIGDHIVNSGVGGGAPEDSQGFTSEKLQRMYNVTTPPPRPSSVHTALVIVLVIVVVLFIYGMVATKDLLDNIGADVAAKGWFLYTSAGCPYCTQQMNLFDSEYPKLVQCGHGRAVVGPAGPGPAACSAIQAFPYWVNAATGDTRTGFQNLEALVQMAE